jgi:phosphate transport system substrate-binding protein
MLKAFRALIVGMMLLTLLAACGGGQTGTGTQTSPSPAPAESPVAEASPSPSPEMSPSPEASPSPEMSPSPEASPSPEMSPEATAEGTDEEPIELPEVDPAEVSGNIITAGSSTVFPLTQAMVERFQSEGYTGDITIDSIGSGAGFERFCVAAETDIANASRPIRDEEVQSCEGNGREPIEFRVGTDALAVVVSAQNDFVDDLSLEQLAQIYGGEATTWADIDPSWPAERIQVYSPGTDSGTFDYFVEEVLDDDESKILNVQGAQFSEDDNVLVTGVEGSPYAIGYFGYAYYEENASRLKALAIDGVEPTEETAESNEYPLSRPLFIYSAQSIMEEKPQVADFINFYLSWVNEEVIDAGYFPASVSALNEAKQKWLDATGQ